MSFILTPAALLRLLRADPADLFTQWIEQAQVRPFITATTLAQALHDIRTSKDIPANVRTTYERRHAALAQLLRPASVGRARPASVLLADFDLAAADILADLLSVDSAADEISDIDLVPAVIAVQHNLRLVITEHIAAWQELAGAIPPESGKLHLHIIS